MGHGMSLRVQVDLGAQPGITCSQDLCDAALCEWKGLSASFYEELSCHSGVGGVCTPPQLTGPRAELFGHLTENSRDYLLEAGRTDGPLNKPCLVSGCQQSQRTVAPLIHGVCSKSPRGHLKPQILLIPVCTMFFSTHTSL